MQIKRYVIGILVAATSFFVVRHYVRGSVDVVMPVSEGIVARTTNDCVIAQIDNLSHRVKAGKSVDDSCFGQLRKMMEFLSAEERLEAWGRIERNIAKPVFREGSLAKRQFAMATYMKTIARLPWVFAAALEDPGKVWRFVFKAYQVLDDEKMAASRPGFDSHNPSMGLFISTSMYDASLDERRFRFTREVFEGKSFGLYFRSLPKEEQIEWFNKIKSAAQRDVCIYDPGNPWKKKPRMQLGRLP